MPRSKQVRVGGYWLNDVGPWGELEYMTRWPGGDFEATWKMDLPAGFQHPALRAGRAVEIMDGPLRIWQGRLSQPDRAEWTFTATGLCREASGFLALDGDGNTTTNVDVAVDAAIARGLPWRRPASLSPVTATSDLTTEGVNTLEQLLDQITDNLGQRWMVDPDGTVSMSLDPTEPTWHLTPGSVSLGLADDEYASTVFVRYSPAAGTFETTSATDPNPQGGYREYPADVTGMGTISATKAANIALGILAKGKARLGWTGAIEATPYTLTTPGGTPADLSAVRARDVVRVHDVDDVDLNGVTFIDIVVSEAHYVDGDSTIQLSPQGLVPRTFEAIQEEVMRRATKDGFRG